MINRTALNYVVDNSFKPPKDCIVCGASYPNFKSVMSPCECTTVFCQLCIRSHLKSHDLSFYGNAICFTCKTKDIPILNIREAAALETRLILSALNRFESENVASENLETLLKDSLSKKGSRNLDDALVLSCIAMNSAFNAPLGEAGVSQSEEQSKDDPEIPQHRRKLARMEYFVRKNKSTSMGPLKKLKFNRNIFYETLLANEVSDDYNVDESDEGIFDDEIPLSAEELSRRKESIARAKLRFGDTWESEDEDESFYRSVPSYVNMEISKAVPSVNISSTLSIKHDDDIFRINDVSMTAFHVAVPGIGYYCPICPAENVCRFNLISEFKEHVRQFHQGKRLPVDALALLKWKQCNVAGCAKFIVNERCGECQKRIGKSNDEVVNVDEMIEVLDLRTTIDVQSSKVTSDLSVSKTVSSSAPVVVPAIQPISTSIVPAMLTAVTTTTSETRPLPSARLVTSTIGTSTTTSSSSNSNRGTSVSSENTMTANKTVIPSVEPATDPVAAAVEKQEIDDMFSQLNEPAKTQLFDGCGLYKRVVGIYGPALKRIEGFRREVLDSFQNRNMHESLKPKVKNLIHVHIKNLKMNTDSLKIVPLMDAISHANCPVSRLGVMEDWPWVKSLPYCQDERIEEMFLTTSEQIVLQVILPSFQYIKSLVTSINAEQAKFESERHALEVSATITEPAATTMGTDGPTTESQTATAVTSTSKFSLPSAQDAELIKRRDKFIRAKELFAKFDFSKFPSYVIEVQVPRSKEHEESEFKEANRGELSLDIQLYFSNGHTLDGRAELLLPSSSSKVQSIKNMISTSLGINIPKVDKFVALNTVNYGVRLQESRSFAYYNITSGSIVRIKPLQFFNAAIETAKVAAATKMRPLSRRENRRQTFWKKLRAQQINDPEHMQWESENFGFLSQSRRVCRWVLTENGWTERHVRAARAGVLGEIMPEGYSTKSSKKAKRRITAISSSSSESSDDDWIDLDDLEGKEDYNPVKDISSDAIAATTSIPSSSDWNEGNLVPPHEHTSLLRPDALPILKIHRDPALHSTNVNKGEEPHSSLSSISATSPVLDIAPVSLASSVAISASRPQHQNHNQHQVNPSITSQRNHTDQFKPRPHSQEWRNKEDRRPIHSSHSHTSKPRRKKIDDSDDDSDELAGMAVTNKKFKSYYS